MNSRVLLVGASSPLGRVIESELSAAGHRVHGVSRSGAKGSDRLDVTDLAQSGRVIRQVQPDVAIYLARPELPESPGQAIADGVTSLRGFAAICAEYGVSRFIFASSAAVYGTESTSPWREIDPIGARTPYASLKLRSERAIAEVGRSSELAALSLRIFNVYGPGFSQSLINRLALGGTPPPVVQLSNHFTRDYIHCDDVARAFRYAVEVPTIEASKLNVGTGIATSNQALVAMFPRSVYSTNPITQPRSESVADISLIRSLWGFEPLVTVSDVARAPDRYLVPQPQSPR